MVGATQERLPWVISPPIPNLERGCLGVRTTSYHTLIESARRHGHESGAYLKDVLARLPGMKAGELDALLPSKWQPAGQAAAPAQMAG